MSSGAPFGGRIRMFVSSLTAFTTAFLVVTILHEGAHAVTGRALGIHPVLHHNYVVTPSDTTGPPRLWVPAAGPIMSLVIGIFCLTILKLRRTRSLVTLQLLWLAIFGWITSLGYLFIGPLAHGGDTGKVYAELGVPVAVQWVLAIGAVVVLIWLVRRTSDEFARHVDMRLEGEARSRPAVANALIAGPIITGAVVTTLLSLPIPTFVSLLFPLTSGFLVIAAYRRFRRSTAPLPEGIRYPARVSAAALMLLIALTAVSISLIGGVTL